MRTSVRPGPRLALVLAGGVLLGIVFHLLHLPGAWLFGPLVASAIFAASGSIVNTTTGRGAEAATAARLAKNGASGVSWKQTTMSGAFLTTSCTRFGQSVSPQTWTPAASR